MGKTVLKSHWVGDNYCQDGYFGVKADGESMIMPIENQNDIKQFQQVFGLERQNDPGLSIVVPWFDMEVTEQTLLHAVLKNYSYAILSGDLDVIVETAGIETLLEQGSLRGEARKFSAQADTLPMIELAEWAISEDAANDRLTLDMPDPNRGWSWSKNLFTAEILKRLGEKITGGERIAMRVPVRVRKRNNTSAVSHFDVYMVNEGTNERARPMFIRDGIVITDVRAPLLARHTCFSRRQSSSAVRIFAPS